MRPKPHRLRFPWSAPMAAIALSLAASAAGSAARAQDRPAPGQGELQVLGGDDAGQPFPLAHTRVEARIDGIVARVSVTQIFTNPYDDKIEAIYIFPLPDRAAVDDMEMQVGERTIRGLIKHREEARRIYEEAKLRGRVASLLDQERPNIFTQSVANILPGNRIEVTIRYVETLPLADGAHEFVFPMVVGPRFIPGTPVGPSLATRDPHPLSLPAPGPGWSPDTDRVPDASRITPPVLAPGERSGHDIAVTLNVHAGLSIQELASPSHAIDVERPRADRAVVRLHPADTIPNKDLVVRYRLAGTRPELTVLSHRRDGEGYFLALIVPPARPAASEVMPKEMVFVVDCSGSMSGEPIAKVKQAMRHALKHLDARDSFQIIRFSDRASGLGSHPLAATPANVKEGLRFIDQLAGEGGTMMIEGIKAALDYPPDPARLRIVCFMTDGYIGNEGEILAAIAARLGDARLFAFGIGSSVNRYLLDRMAEVGRGAVDFVLLGEDTQRAVSRFYDRVRSPVVTDLSFSGAERLAIADVYPERIPDLFAGQAVTLVGRYTAPGRATVTLAGRLGGRPYRQDFVVDLPARTEAGSEALGSVWARTRIEDLMARQHRGEKREIEAEVTRIALAHRLVSAYTSFVAVEERIEVAGGVPRTVVVPVEMPEGVSYEGVFGASDEAASRSTLGFLAPMKQAARGPMKSLPPQGAPRSAAEAPEQATGAAPLQAPPASAPLRASLVADRTRARSSDQVTLTITIRNVSPEAIQLPAPLRLGAGGIELRIIDGAWKEVPATLGRPAPAPRPASQRLAPGTSVVITITIGGPGGLRLPASGLYHLAVAAAGGWPVSSDLLSLRIDP